jgi:hypothetical protein
MAASAEVVEMFIAEAGYRLQQKPVPGKSFTISQYVADVHADDPNRPWLNANGSPHWPVPLRYPAAGARGLEVSNRLAAITIWYNVALSRWASADARPELPFIEQLAMRVRARVKAKLVNHFTN